MSSPVRPVAAALREAPETARLLARVEATQRIALRIAPVCRSLAAGFDPLLPGRCECRETVVWLTASSTAQAAKLRQAVPRMLATLTEEGIRVYEMRVRVEPGITGDPERGRSRPSSPDDAWLNPSRSAGDEVDKFALTVAESPLRQAILRLAATLKKRARP